MDDLRYHAAKFGPVKDIYIPRDYYTKQPRGIAFVGGFAITPATGLAA
jgi:FUS-interacting serine-arginine-rich protein 1